MEVEIKRSSGTLSRGFLFISNAGPRKFVPRDANPFGEKNLAVTRMVAII
jgi:hypothetical protein